MRKELFKPEYIVNYRQVCSMPNCYVNEKDICPLIYLEFAKDDLSDGNGRRQRVNSVGNAKRAFHFQVEMLCDALGWDEIYGKKNIPFPQRLEYLGRCGVISPNILRKLNHKRNEIEHDYYIPSENEVEDYLDIVELFLMSTRGLLSFFPEYLEFEIVKGENYDITLGLPESLKVEITICKGGCCITAGKERVIKKINDADYFDWLLAIMKMYMI